METILFLHLFAWRTTFQENRFPLFLIVLYSIGPSIGIGGAAFGIGFIRKPLRTFRSDALEAKSPPHGGPRRFPLVRRRQPNLTARIS
jgi:hypothetical protein